jgi:aspartate ammonia-lyase
MSNDSNSNGISTRSEHDLIGDEEVPVNAYYGIQTQRAMKNFDITGVPISHFPQLIRALAMVKKACALANNELGHLSRTKKNAIVAACDEIIYQEKWHDQFPVDLIQGGAGTSTNMNANEVCNYCQLLLILLMMHFIITHKTDLFAMHHACPLCLIRSLPTAV